MTELTTAIDRNDLTALKLILQETNDPDERDPAGRTALMYAALAGKSDFVKLLITFRASVNAEDKSGNTALHFASQDYRPETVEVLCASGANINAEDKFGNTPLWKGIFNSRRRGDVIRILLQHGAEPDRKNKAGKSPRALAETIANYDVKQFLR